MFNYWLDKSTKKNTSINIFKLYKNNNSHIMYTKYNIF